MYELDRKDQIRFDRYIARRRIAQNAAYDFTFEHRFAVYHAPMCNQNVYFAYDKRCGRSVRVCSRREGVFGPYDYRLLIPKLLYAIKYTGDRRYLRPYADSPESRIDLIFRSLLPQQGYQIREKQIRLAKQLYRGMVTGRAIICEAEPGTGAGMAYLVAALCAKRQQPLAKNALPPIAFVASGPANRAAAMQQEAAFLSHVLQAAGMIDRPLTAILRQDGRPF